MSKHLERDFQNIHKRLMNLFALVEKMIDNAAQALCDRELDLAPIVIATDKQVDAMEVEIEEECLKCLALHQPVATDLRRLTTVLKVNVELERIADLACNIVERAEGLHQSPFFPVPDPLPIMVRQATEMVRMALDAFVDSDAQLARRVIAADEAVDRNNLLVIEELQSLLHRDSTLVEPALHCFSASRHVERIADLAQNIAEDVIYLVDGDIVRHQPRKSITEQP